MAKLDFLLFCLFLVFNTFCGSEEADSGLSGSGSGSGNDMDLDVTTQPSEIIKRSIN